MRGIYDFVSAVYDDATYDITQTGYPRTATALKAQMDAVIAALDALIAAPSGDTVPLLAAVDGLVLDAEASKYSIVEPSGSVKTWVYVDGRYTAGDVADSARTLARDIRHAVATRHPNPWAKIKRDIHPSWYSFYHDSHTT